MFKFILCVIILIVVGLILKKLRSIDKEISNENVWKEIMLKSGPELSDGEILFFMIVWILIIICIANIINLLFSGFI